MRTTSTDLWSAELRSLRGIPQQGVRLPPDAVLDEGTVVLIARAGEPRGYGVRGPAVVRDGVLVPVGEREAQDLCDPSRIAERRYAEAVDTAGLPTRETRFTEAAGHDWEPETAYPVEDGGLALIACTRVRGRHVWKRAATYDEAKSMGVTP